MTENTNENWNEMERKLMHIALFSEFQAHQFKKKMKQSWLPVFWKKIQNTQEVKENAFLLDKQQNVRIFEKVLFFQTTYNIKT